MPSYSHASRRQRGGGGMSTATLLAAKVAVASAALAAAASLARLAVVPHLVSLAGAVFPRAWAVARFWLAPPYLFVTVHLIILVIWKISDHKQHLQAAAQQPHHHKQQDNPWPAVALDDDVAPAVKANNKEEEEFSPPDSGGGDSCVTTESDEDASSAPSYIYDNSAELARGSVVVEPPVPQVVQQRAVLEREVSLPPSSQTVECEGGGGDDDLDATWNAIMQKTRSAQEPPPRARDPSVGAEEMNRRFDDFIKKKRNSFGRQ